MYKQGSFLRQLDNLQECPLPQPTPHLFLFFAKGIPFPLRVFSVMGIFEYWELVSGFPFSGAGGRGQGVEVNNLPFLSWKELLLRRRIKLVVKRLFYLLPEGLALFCVDLMYF